MTADATMSATAAPLTRRTWFIRSLQVLVIATFIGLWEGLGQLGILDKFFYSRPSLIVPRIWGWLAEGLTATSIYRDIEVTLIETVLGFVIGTLAGVAIGYAFARNRLLGQAFDPLLSMFNAIPRLVLAPVFILAFGIDLASKVALGVTLVFFIVFFATFTAVRDVDQTLVDNVRVLGARRRDVTLQVLLPAAFSAIVASLRTSAGFAFAGAVVAEYIGSSVGVGRRIANSEAFFDSTGVFGGIVVIAALALALDAFLQVVEGWFSRWKPRRER
jgi:NitT/TauT family transport system permease protein